LHTHVASKNKDMNEMNDAHAYEMQCNYGSQTPEVLQPSPYKNLIPRFGKRTIVDRIPYNHHVNSLLAPT
jgi:hypothetical protein